MLTDAQKTAFAQELQLPEYADWVATRNVSAILSHASAKTTTGSHVISVKDLSDVLLNDLAMAANHPGCSFDIGRDIRRANKGISVPGVAGILGRGGEGASGG